MEFYDFIDYKLNKTACESNYRQINFFIKNNSLPKIMIDDREYLNFSSNDYLNLSSNKEIIEEFNRANLKYGVGAKGSRLTSGSYDCHLELERKLAKLKNKESALVYQSGYCANLGIFSAFDDKNICFFSDKLNHRSIVDGINLSKAEFKRFKHKDYKDLEKKLKISKAKIKIIITDGVFSMDGDICDLKKLIELKLRYKALLAVDDAHGFMVLGKKGKGIYELFDLNEKLLDEVDIHIGTFSKAIGLTGGYIVSTKKIIDYLINYSSAFIYSTALSPSNCKAIIKSIDIAKNMQAKRIKLKELCLYAKEKLQEEFEITNTKSTIIAIILKDSQLTLKYYEELLKNKIYLKAIRPPSVQKNQSRLRVSITLAHSKADIDYLINMLKKIKKDLSS